MIMKKDYNHIEIEVDGGIKLNNIQEVAEAGADIIVFGSGIFNGKPIETITETYRTSGRQCRSRIYRALESDAKEHRNRVGQRKNQLPHAKNVGVGAGEKSMRTERYPANISRPE